MAQHIINVSYPSRHITILDAPDVSGLDAKFIYNFFTPDESLNDSSSAAINNAVAATSDFNDLKRRVPRYIKLTFTPVAITGKLSTANEFKSTEISQQIKIKDVIDKIQDESTFSGKQYIGLEFQDDNVDRKLFTLVSGSMSKHVTANNRLIEDKISNNINTIISNLDDEHSLLDAAKAYATSIPDSISSDVIIDALNQIDKLKVDIVDDEKQKSMISDAFQEIRNVCIKTQISNRIVGSVIKNIVNDPMSIYSDEFVRLQYSMLGVQRKALHAINPAAIFKSEFETQFNATQISNNGLNDVPASSVIMGYLIEKNEILNDGTIKKHDPITVDNPQIATVIDPNVAYGKTYVYTIKSVSKLNVQLTVDDSADVVLGEGYIASKRSARVFVQCIESISPPPPADFNIKWDYTKSVPLLMWNIPVEPQRDVKGFQIFKRESLKEPFQLIKQIDFDDSLVKINGFETPDNSLVEKFSSPVLSFFDYEFLKKSIAIYAICSIDAHGLSSNYSMQFAVTFNALKNVLEKKLIANSGAPKSYPNMTLKNELFVDLMKTSGYRKVSVYFDPEYLNVYDSLNNDVGLLSCLNVNNGYYKLQFINTDLVEQDVVDIKLIDIRSNK